MQAPELDLQTIRLHKSNNGMGLSIVAAKVSYLKYNITCIILRDLPLLFRALVKNVWVSI